MDDKALTAIGAFLASIVGLAALAVVLGKSSQTVGVLNSAGNAISSIIGAAVSPVTGANASVGGLTPGAGAGGAGAMVNPINFISGALSPLDSLNPTQLFSA